MGLRQTTPPERDPVTVTEAVNWCKVNTEADDGVLADLITAATNAVESQTNRQLIEASWTYTLNGWDRKIAIPRAPLVSVTKIEYRDTNGNLVELPEDQYQVITTQDPGYVKPAPGASWPSHELIDDAITIVYLAGNGKSPDDVPRELKIAILQLVETAYTERGAVLVGATAEEMPGAANAIIDRFRVFHEIV